MKLRHLAIIGDIGGHLDIFTRVLEDLGVNLAKASIPQGLTIVQVGDLVHKGPQSDEVVHLADALLKKNPAQYLQLLGNHEAHYLGGPSVKGRSGVSDISEQSQETLRSWYARRDAKLAYSFQTKEYGNILVTHGGLTAGLWVKLGSPLDPRAAAFEINLLMEDPVSAFRPGWLMTSVLDLAAGVTGSRTGSELAASWLAKKSMPFSQVHGHEGVWWWPLDNWHEDVPENVKERATVDSLNRTCQVEIEGKTLLSVDWVLGNTAPPNNWPPLVLTLET